MALATIRNSIGLWRRQPRAWLERCADWHAPYWLSSWTWWLRSQPVFLSSCNHPPTADVQERSFSLRAVGSRGMCLGSAANFYLSVWPAKSPSGDTVHIRAVQLRCRQREKLRSNSARGASPRIPGAASSQPSREHSVGRRASRWVIPFDVDTADAGSAATVFALSSGAVFGFRSPK